MCGLLGFITQRPSQDVWLQFEKLWQASQVRGMDAAGVIAIPVSGGASWTKGPGSATRIMMENSAYKENILAKANQWVAALGHTRAGTQGDADDNNNNHPIVTQDILGMHNGIISNDQWIREQLDPEWVPRGEVDSAPPLAYLNQMVGDKPDIGAIREVFGQVHGWWTYQFIFRQKPQYLWFAKGDSPLTFGWDPDHRTLWWASTARILAQGVPQCRLIWEGRDHHDPSLFVLPIRMREDWDMRGKEIREQMKVLPRWTIEMDESTHDWRTWWGTGGTRSTWEDRDDGHALPTAPHFQWARSYRVGHPVRRPAWDRIAESREYFYDGLWNWGPWHRTVYEM